MKSLGGLKSTGLASESSVSGERDKKCKNKAKSKRGGNVFIGFLLPSSLTVYIWSPLVSLALILSILSFHLCSSLSFTPLQWLPVIACCFVSPSSKRPTTFMALLSKASLHTLVFLPFFPLSRLLLEAFNYASYSPPNGSDRVVSFDLSYFPVEWLAKVWAHVRYSGTANTTPFSSCYRSVWSALLPAHFQLPHKHG